MLFLCDTNRGSYLSDLEKGTILAFSDEDLSRQEIDLRLNRSHKVVVNYLNNPANKKSAPKKKISPRTERRLITIASNIFKSCRRIGQECQANVSR